MGDRLERKHERALPRIAGCDELSSASEYDALGWHENRDRFVDALLSLCALVLKQRDCYGSCLGVSGPQFAIIIELAQSPGITVTDLARKMEVSASFIAIELKKLIELKIAEKRKNPLDARSVILELTSKGRTALADLTPLRDRWDETMYRNLDRERVQILQDTMERIVADGRVASVDFERSVRQTTGFPRFRRGSGTGLRMRSARIR